VGKDPLLQEKLVQTGKAVVCPGVFGNETPETTCLVIPSTLSSCGGVTTWANAERSSSDPAEGNKNGVCKRCCERVSKLCIPEKQ